MRLELASDWKEILTYAWSVRALVIAALLSGAEAVIPAFDVNPWVVFAVVAAALVARVVAQKGLSG